MKRPSGTMLSPKLAFLLGTLFAVVGTVDAAVTTCTGAASGVYNTEDNPGGSGVIACKCVAGYVSTGASNTAVVGDVTLTCTKCAPGYYLSAGDSTATAVCTQAPANKWHAGLNDLSSVFTAETAVSCPSNSESVAGSSAMADCTVKAGYYIETESTNDSTEGALAITIAPQNWYAPGGASATLQDSTSPGIVAATRTACPYGGTTPADGKTALTDCVVTCGAASVKAKAQGGTCVCEATHYGKPVGDIPTTTTSAPTQGCLAAGKFTLAAGALALTDNLNTYTGHGMTVGDLFVFGEVSAAGTAHVADSTYMVAATASANTFTLRGVTAANAAVTANTENSAAETYLTPAGKAILPASNDNTVITTSPAHGLSNGAEITYEDGGGTAIDGLTDATKYYAKVTGSTTFSVALKPGAAAVSTIGVHTAQHYFKFVGVKGITIPIAGIAIASDTITFAAHGLSNGDQVIYNNGGGDAAAGLTNLVRYFVRDVSTNTFKVSTTPGGLAADITATGNDAQYFTTVGRSDLANNVCVTGGPCPVGTGVSGTEAGTSVTTLATDGDGVTALGQCAVKAGYYIGAKSGTIGSTGSLSVLPAPLNFYAAGGLAADQQETATNAGRTACPFVGTTGRAAVQSATVANNIFTSAGHGLSDGDQVIYQSGTGAVATSFTDGNIYYVRDASTDTFKIAATSGGTAVTLAAGTDTQYFTPSGKTLVTQCTPGASTPAIATTSISSDVITITAHGLSDGDQVQYQNGGSTALDYAASAASNADIFYVSDKTADTFKLTTVPGVAAGALAAGNNAQYLVIPSAGDCGASSVNAENYLGTCRCKANFHGAVTNTNNIATGGCVACPFGGASAAGSSAVTDCTPAASASTVNVVTVGGTSVCAANYYGDPTSTTSGAVATGGCTACPTNSESAAGGAADLAACTVKAGYYIATESATTTDATGLVISQVPANSYGVGGASASEQNDATVTATKTACPFGGTSLAGAGFVEDCVPDCGATTVNALSARGTCICAPNYYGAPTSTTSGAVATGGCTACPTNSESAAGEAANLAACTVKAGYYIATESTSASDATSLVISIAPVNWYAAGGASASEQTDSTVTATRLACPHDGTTPATGKTALSDCVPDCNTAYASSVALGGTCVCKSTTYGAPTPTNAKPTGGCTACPSGKYVQTAYTAATGGSASSGVAAATTGVADCDVQAGFYISVQSTSTTNIDDLTVIQIGANKYAAGLSGTTQVTSDDISTAAALACPYAGTTVQAGGKLSDCTPSCGSGTNAVALGGTCVCDTTHYGLPVDAEGTTTSVVTQGCTACPTNSVTAYTVAAPSGDLATCKVKPGYYIATESGTATDATGLVISQVPANSYGVGGAAASEQTDSTVTATKTTCVVKSTSSAGSDAISDCKTSAGYYLSVASPSATGSGRIAKSEANKFSAGGASISTTTVETATSCTYGGTSPIGSVVAGCTPNCGTVAVADAGSCTCKAGRTGVPTPTTAVVTGGCTATLCAVNEYVKDNVCTTCLPGTTIAKDGDASGANTACAKTKCAVNEYVKANVCTACASGTTIAKDGDASGANTACAKTKCAVNEYVKSNVCTACDVGSTNVVGDDASGVDTTCDADTVSSASRSDISYVIFVVAALLAFAAL
jgi:phenylpyruvate tautomerase PptA (4-oxalocrotonate tautomerase family)